MKILYGVLPDTRVVFTCKNGTFIISAGTVNRKQAVYLTVDAMRELLAWLQDHPELTEKGSVT